jgi:hypothetical protein
MSVPLPGTITIRNIKTPQLWLETGVDSLGNYSVDVPQGNYEIYFPDAYFINGKELYIAIQKKHQKFSVRSGEKFLIPKMTINGEVAPDLIPRKVLCLILMPQQKRK